LRKNKVKRSKCTASNERFGEKLAIEIEFKREKFQRDKKQSQSKELEKYVGKWQGFQVTEAVREGATVPIGKTRIFPVLNIKLFLFLIMKNIFLCLSIMKFLIIII